MIFSEIGEDDLDYIGVWIGGCLFFKYVGKVLFFGIILYMIIFNYFY